MGPGKGPPPREKTNAEKVVGFRATCPLRAAWAMDGMIGCDYASPRTETPEEAEALLHEHLNVHAQKNVRVVWE